MLPPAAAGGPAAQVANAFFCRSLAREIRSARLAMAAASGTGSGWPSPTTVMVSCSVPTASRSVRSTSPETAISSRWGRNPGVRTSSR